MHGINLEGNFKEFDLLKSKKAELFGKGGIGKQYNVLTFTDQLDEVLNQLEKSHIHYAFDQKELISKKGEELIPAIAQQEMNELQEAIAHKQKAEQILEMCDSQPTRDLDEYQYHNTKNYFAVKPLMFKIKYDGPINMETQAESEDPKEQYNHCISEYVDATSEAIKLGILKRNIIADKTYRLTLDQAAALGL